jgi:hypothetical protein
MEADGMRVVEWYPTQGAARQFAASLVEHGVGATIETGSDRFGVAVLEADIPRARELLGLADDPGAEPETEADLAHANRAWLIPVLVAAAVLVIVPLTAFFVSFKLSGG